MPETDIVLSVVSATKKLPSGAPLLTDVNLSVPRGRSVSILGRSGSGKGTLLGILGLMDRFDSGTYLLDGKSVAGFRPRAADNARGSTLGFVFQRFCLIPYLTALENVQAPLLHRRKFSVRIRRRRAEDLLERVGLGGHLRKKPHQLSGGEQQRVAIARALVGRPQVILADEPTGALDTANADSVLDLLFEQVEGRGTALVVVTHDELIARRTSDSYRLIDGSLHQVMW